MRIEALHESILERVDSIEDGSYWDNPDSWDDEGYDEEDPDYIGDEHFEALQAIFEETEDLFLEDCLEEARRIYTSLFELLDYIGAYSYSIPPFELDIREEWARYCRCVYDTEDEESRIAAFAAAMQVDLDASSLDHLFRETDFPNLQDVADARAVEMPGLDAFLPAWRALLAEKNLRTRSADLLLEVVERLDGLAGVAKLARQWKNTQPKGFLHWLDSLNGGKEFEQLWSVGEEALEAIKAGSERERICEFMIGAAVNLDDKKRLLHAKRERLFSRLNDHNLLELANEAYRQKALDSELTAVIKRFKGHRPRQDDEKALYTKILLMAGRLDDAFALVKGSRPVGWSHGDRTGMVFGAVLSAVVSQASEATIIKNLFKRYCSRTAIYSGGISVEEGGELSFDTFISSALAACKISSTQKEAYFDWAEKIGTQRIDHIVSNKFRRAYERAAAVLGALAETYAATEQPDQAKKIIKHYYKEKYNRFPAFRREVKNVVHSSILLKDFRSLLK